MSDLLTAMRQDAANGKYIFLRHCVLALEVNGERVRYESKRRLPDYTEITTRSVNRVVTDEWLCDLNTHVRLSSTILDENQDRVIGR